MALLLSTTATCVCCNTPLEGKSLRDVAEHGLQKAENPPSYKVTLTKSKVSFKPVSKGVEKLKSIELRKVDDTYVNEKSNVIAYSFLHKKKPTCLALQFSDTNTRKEFQTLAKTSISNAKKSKKKNKKKKKKEEESKSKKSQQDKALKEKTSNSTLESQHKRPSNSTLTLSDVEASQPSRRVSSPRLGDKERRSSLPPSVKDESDVCSHCHQKLPKRITASRIEYDPPNYMPSHSPRPRAKSYDFSLDGGNGSVCYIGPRSSTRKSHQSPSTGRSWVPRHRSHNRFSPSDTRADEDEGSSFNSTASSLGDGHFIRVGAINCKTPVPQRRSSPFRTTVSRPISKRRDSKRSKHHSIVYYIYDSSGDEEGESDDYESDSTSMDGSVSSYVNVPCVASVRSKKIEKLLHELGKPGAIRLY